MYSQSVLRGKCQVSLLVCVRLWRVACDCVTSYTMWRLDRVTSWSCDELTGSHWIDVASRSCHTVYVAFLQTVQQFSSPGIWTGECECRALWRRMSVRQRPVRRPARTVSLPTILSRTVTSLATAPCRIILHARNKLKLKESFFKNSTQHYLRTEVKASPLGL